MITEFTALKQQAAAEMPWLKDSRIDHVVRCTLTALKLAKTFEADIQTVYTAAFYHDYAKGRETELLQTFGGSVKDYIEYPDTLHAPLGALALRYERGLTDENILDCIRNHCTGVPAMSKEEQIVYLADAIEPGRDYPGVDDIRIAAKANLNNAVFIYSQGLVDYLNAQNKKINPYSIECLNYYRNLQNNERRGKNESV